MLDLHIDRRRNESTQEQLYNHILEYARIHHINDELLMPELDLFSKTYNISFDDAQKLYTDLVDANVLEKIEGQYRLIRFQVPSIIFDKLTSIVELIKMNHFEPSVKELGWEVVDAPKELLKLHSESVGQYYCVQRLYYGDKKPLMVVKIYYPLSKYKDLDKADLEGQFIWGYILENYDIKLNYSISRYHAVNIDKQMMNYLNSNHQLANLIESVLYSEHNEVLQYIAAYTISDAFSIVIETDVEQ